MLGKDVADVYVQRNAGPENGRLQVALRRGELYLVVFYQHENNF